MRVSFITDEASQEPRDFLRLAAEHAVDALELRTLWNRHISALSAGELTVLRRMFADAGVQVVCIASSAFKCAIDAPLETELTKLVRALDAAVALDCRLIRIFTYWRSEHAQPNERIAGAVARAQQEAGPRGITLAIENGKRTTHSSGRDLGRFIDLLRDRGVDGVGAVWDPANSISGKSDPEPLENGYPALRPHILHVHVKNVRPFGGEWRFVPLGDGVFDWDAQIERLARDRYRGCLSIETHWRPSHQLKPELLDLPGGDAFSADGYAATSSCLQFVRERIRGIEAFA